MSERPRNWALASRAKWVDVPEPEKDEALHVRLLAQSRGYGATIPRCDLADLADAALVHDVYRVFGQSLTLADPKRDDRHVLALLLAYHMMASGSHVLVPVWRDIHGVANDILFGIDTTKVKPRPSGRMLLAAMARVRRVGPHSWVGLFGWQRENLASRELGINDGSALAAKDWQLVWMATIIDAAFTIMKDQWGDLTPAELLELARRHQLNTLSFKITDRLIQAAEKIERENKADLAPIDYDEEAENIDADPEAGADPWDTGRPAPGFPDHASGRRGTVGFVLVEEILALEQTIALAPTETIRRHLEQLLRVMLHWEGDRKPTNRDLADAIHLSIGRVKQLLEIARVIRQRALADPGSESRR